MTARMSPEEVRDFWTEQALEHGAAPQASWSDVRVIEMEIREIGSRIDDGDTVLDVGCANGFSTVQFAAAKAIDITGIDLIPEMIALAQDRLPALEGKLAGSVAFDVGDAMSLQFEDGRFDKVVSARVVINLGQWTRQLIGLRECLRVLKPRGVLLLSEASLQGWQKMNAMRVEWGLTEIPMPGFNSYIDEERLVRRSCRGRGARSAGQFFEHLLCCHTRTQAVARQGSRRPGRCRRSARRVESMGVDDAGGRRLRHPEALRPAQTVATVRTSALAGGGHNSLAYRAASVAAAAGLLVSATT